MSDHYPQKPTGLQHYILFIGLALVFIIGFNKTLAVLNQHWLTLDGNLAHGWIIVLLSLYLQHQQLKTAYTLKTPSILGAAALTTTSFIWFLGALANIDLLQQISLLSILFTTYWSLFGLITALKLIPAISVMFFAIPIWGYLTQTLVDLASYIVSYWIELTAIPALIQGNSFFLPSGQVDIAGGCSGVRYLNVAMALALYIGLSGVFTIKRRVFLLLTAIFLALLMNWLRIFILILIAYYSEMTHPLINDHENFGWLLFIFVIIPLILLGRKQYEKPLQEQQSARKPIHPTTILLTSAALLLGPILFHLKAEPATPTVKTTSWEKSDLLITPTQNRFNLTINNANQYQSFLAQYKNKNIGIDLIKNWQNSLRDNLIPYNYSLFSDAWIQKNKQIIELNNGVSATLLTLERKPYGEHALLMYWFYVGQYQTHNYKYAKIMQLGAKIQNQNLFTAVGLTLTCEAQDCQNEKNTLVLMAQKIPTKQVHPYQ